MNPGGEFQVRNRAKAQCPQVSPPPRLYGYMLAWVWRRGRLSLCKSVWGLLSTMPVTLHTGLLCIGSPDVYMWGGRVCSKSGLHLGWGHRNRYHSPRRGCQGSAGPGSSAECFGVSVQRVLSRCSLHGPQTPSSLGAFLPIPCLLLSHLSQGLEHPGPPTLLMHAHK